MRTRSFLLSLALTAASPVATSSALAQYGACPPAPAPSGPGVPGNGAPGGPASPGTPGAGPVPLGIPGPSTPGPDAPGAPSIPGVATSLGSFAQNDLHWSHWWYLESARYMDIRAHIQGPPAADGRSVLMSSPLAPSRNLVTAKVTPVLLKIAAESEKDDMVAAALLALGRVVEADSPVAARARAVIEARISAPNVAVADSAILALGLLGQPEASAALADILRVTPAGKRLVDSESMPLRKRAFAAHALGLAAVRTEDVLERQRIALELVASLEEDSHAANDVPVAALSSLGLVNLPSRLQVPAEDLRERKGLEHVLSNRGLTRFLAGWALSSQRGRTRLSTVIRAHACVALARAAADTDEALRASVVERLTALGGHPKAHVQVRTAANIGLGEVARAGNAPCDRGARRHLLDAVDRGQPLEARFARIAVATAASRPGAGDDAFSGTDEVRSTLTGDLARSSSGEMAWSALALGILEERSRIAGRDNDGSVVRALNTLAMRRRSDNDSAALGIGLALAARDTERASSAGERLVMELNDTSTPEMRGFLAVALGLIEHRAAVPTLEAELTKARSQPLLTWSTAVGLGLMGEAVSTGMVQHLERSSSTSERIALSAALGQTGTTHAVDPLLELAETRLRPSIVRASAIDALGAICDLDRLPWRDPIAHSLPYFASTQSLTTAGLGLLERPW